MAQKYIVQHRGGNEDVLNAYQGKIYDRELIVERSNDGYTRLKLGDGKTSYVDLPYLNTVGYASVVQRVSVELFTANWVGEDSPYSQVVEIPDITANSKVDLQTNPIQLTYLQDEEISLVAVNDAGVITVYAIGYKPTVDFSKDSELGVIQATVSETVSE